MALGGNCRRSNYFFEKNADAVVNKDLIAAAAEGFSKEVERVFPMKKRYNR